MISHSRQRHVAAPRVLPANKMPPRVQRTPPAAAAPPGTGSSAPWQTPLCLWSPAGQPTARPSPLQAQPPATNIPCILLSSSLLLDTHFQRKGCGTSPLPLLSCYHHGGITADAAAGSAAAAGAAAGAAARHCLTFPAACSSPSCSLCISPYMSCAAASSSARSADHCIAALSASARTASNAPRSCSTSPELAAPICSSTQVKSNNPHHGPLWGWLTDQVYQVWKLLPDGAEVVPMHIAQAVTDMTGVTIGAYAAVNVT